MAIYSKLTKTIGKPTVFHYFPKFEIVNFTTKTIKNRCGFGLGKHTPKNQSKTGFGRVLGSIWGGFGTLWALFWALLAALGSVLWPSKPTFYEPSVQDRLQGAFWIDFGSILERFGERCGRFGRVLGGLRLSKFKLLNTRSSLERSCYKGEPLGILGRLMASRERLQSVSWMLLGRSGVSQNDLWARVGASTLFLLRSRSVWTSLGVLFTVSWTLSTQLHNFIGGLSANSLSQYSLNNMIYFHACCRNTISMCLLVVHRIFLHVCNLGRRITKVLIGSVNIDTVPAARCLKNLGLW